MINIINLLNTTLITMGCGAKFLQTPKPRYNANQNTTYDIAVNEQNNVWYNNVNLGTAFSYRDANQQLMQITQYADYQKKNIYGYTTSMIITGTIYTDLVYAIDETRNEESYRSYIYDSNHNTSIENNYTTSMVVLRIQTNNTNIDNDASLNYRYSINRLTDSWINGVLGQYINYGKINVETYTTTDNWDNLINLTTYSVNKNALIQQYVGPQGGFNYQYSSQTLDAIVYSPINNEDSSYDIESISTDITINQTKTNYVIIKITPYINYSNTSGANLYGTGIAYGYDKGYVSSTSDVRIAGTMIINPGSYEIIDLPGLMFDVLTMPFSFISIAFNLTLFPGTPYQVNISNLFLAIFAILAFVFILKILLTLKSGTGNG